MSDKHSKSEVGHLKNITELNEMINAVELLQLYDPVNPMITIVDLRKKHNECNDLFKIAVQKKGTYTHLVNERQYAFDAMGILSTRVLGAVVVHTSNDKKTVEDTQVFIDKLRGTPAMPETDEDDDGQEIREARSNAQTSFDNRAGHFEALVEFVEGISGYNPNEEDLRIPALKAVYANLIMLNNNISKAEAALAAAARERNHALYNEIEGLYFRTQIVKWYVKSVYKSHSPSMHRSVNSNLKIGH